jgi:hypothetical protein
MSLQSLVAQATSAAFRAVGDMGGVLYIRRETEGVFDPATGMTTPGETVNFPCLGIIMDYERERVDGTAILASDKKALIDASSLETVPVAGDNLVTHDDILSVVHVYTTQPNETAFIYKLQVRRS